MNIKATSQREKLQPYYFICITCNRQHIGRCIYCRISAGLAANNADLLAALALPKQRADCLANRAKEVSGIVVFPGAGSGPDMAWPRGPPDGGEGGTSGPVAPGFVQLHIPSHNYRDVVRVFFFFST